MSDSLDIAATILEGAAGFALIDTIAVEHALAVAMGDAGISSVRELELSAIAETVRRRHLSHTQVHLLLKILTDAKKPAEAAELALAAWDSGETKIRHHLAFLLPGALSRMGRSEDLLRVYREIVDLGLVIGDLRPKIAESVLASVAPDLAAELYDRDKAAFEVFLRQRESKTPAIGTSGGGAVAPGALSATVSFQIPIVRAVTGNGDAVGVGGAVFGGQVAAFTAGARYRFEYGLDESALDRATAWAEVAPPRTGRFIQRLYRQAGAWQPTCIKAKWRFLQDGTPVLSAAAPFARDRNQLSGIGAHEMAVGITWAQSRASFEENSTPRPRDVIGGGVQDLRDAEMTFTLAARNLRQKGAALHFWISHADRDEHGSFISQWALTGAPVPDDVLASDELRKVTLRLVNDPRLWTYTGNNPDEQGEHAARYRRLPLDTTLTANNTTCLLIFALGDPRCPVEGGLIFSGAELSYRDQSVLSPAAGAVITSFPPSAADPLWITSGVTGDEERLWTSAPGARSPLEFRWVLRRSVTATHFQICQHPYWPAREAEVLAEDADGARRSLWRGVLPEGPDRGNLQTIVEFLPEGPAVSAVILRLLSGHHPERCGVDSFALYGAGAVFQPDGQACSVSEEVQGLASGHTVYYRVVLEDGADTITGSVRNLELPPTSAPLLLEASPLVRPDDPACYVVRANAMGLETRLWGELEGADGRILAAPPVSLGRQPTGRHIYYVPSGIPDLPGVFRLRASNASGEAVLTAPWPITAPAT